MSYLGQAAAAPRVCPATGIPTLETIRPFTDDRANCAAVFGVADARGVIRKAVARAVEMLDNTIAELTNARNAVCRGEPPASPQMGDITAVWLRDKLGVCIDNIGVWTAGTFVNGSVAEVIRRLTRVRNLIASNVIRYICNDPGCGPATWAFVQVFANCAGTAPTIIHLCRNFWIPGAGVDADTHAEFQAQTILHEASHLYHCTSLDPAHPGFEARGASIGVAECFAQFVAATNNSPLDPNFTARCTRSSRCATPAPVHGLGEVSPAPRRLITVSVSFNPRNAIRLRGRPAGRRTA